MNIALMAQRSVSLLLVLGVTLGGLCLQGCYAGRNRSLHLRSEVTIVDTRSDRVLTEESFCDQLANAKYILLGEQHDQAAHHWHRANILRRLASRGRLLVSLEHIQPEQEILLQQNLHEFERLEQLLSWNDSGWPSWSIFVPLFRTFAEIQAQVVSAKRVSDLTSYGVNVALPNQTSLEAVLSQSHQPINPSLLEKMVLTQRRWDASMAASLNADEAVRHRVLLAGNGHVRKDFGVPWYLKFNNPQASVIAVGYSIKGLPLEDGYASLYDFMVLVEPVSRNSQRG